MAGWIKLHRDIMDHWIAQDCEYLAVWIRMLAEANFDDRKTVMNGAFVEVKRGQFVFGLESYSAKTGVSIRRLRKLLELLESDGMIVRQKGNKFSLITIANYSKHQDDDRQTSGESQANDKQTSGEGQAKGNTIRSKELKEVKDPAQIAQADALPRTDGVLPFPAKQKPESASAEFIKTQFNRFYDAYKVKKSKIPAEKAFAKLMRGKSENQVRFWTALVMSHYHHEFDNDTGGYDKLYPATYLNNKRWEDSPEFMQQFKQDWIEYQQQKTGASNGTTN